MGKKRAILASVAAAALALTMVGCSSSGSTNSAKGSTITYWASNQGTSVANDKAVLTPVLAKFTKDTGIKVNLEVIGWNDLQTRIQTAVTSGQGPDVVNIGNTWASSLQATKAFLPFDSTNMSAIGGSGKFVKTALQTGGAPGTDPTSVPLYGFAYGLYYNKKMLAAAGLTPPTTWEQLVTDAQKLTNPAAHVWGMSLAAGSYTENIHFAFITGAQGGASPFDSKGNPTFTEPAAVDGIQRYIDLMQKDKVVSPSDAQIDNASVSTANFAQGKAAMILNQNNADATITSNGMTSDQYGVVAFPAPSNAKSNVATFPAGINMSIFKNTKHKDAALQFVKYMTSAATQSTLGKPYASLPVLKGANATFTTNADEAKTFLDIYNNRSKPLPLVPTEDQYENTVGKAMNALFAKVATGGTVTNADIKSALQTAQDQVKAAG